MIVKHESKMNKVSDCDWSKNKSFKYRGTKFLNALDEKLKSTANLKYFKFTLKPRLLGGNKKLTFYC